MERSLIYSVAWHFGKMTSKQLYQVVRWSAAFERLDELSAQDADDATLAHKGIGRREVTVREHHLVIVGQRGGCDVTEGRRRRLHGVRDRVLVELVFTVERATLEIES